MNIINIVDNNVNENVITDLHGFCTGPDFNYDVYWNDPDGTVASVQVVNAGGTVLATGTTSPLSVLIRNNSSTAGLDIQVREQADVANISAVVTVARKNCVTTETNQFNYTATGTNNGANAPYTITTGTTHIRASVIGGGGNGARKPGSGAGAGTNGGGGGAAAISVVPVEIGDVFDITVGAGRASGPGGTGRGGSSTIQEVGAAIVARAEGGQGRGQGNRGAPASSGGRGAPNSIGDVINTGANGGVTNNNSAGSGGAAGDFIDGDVGGASISGSDNNGNVAGGGGSGLNGGGRNAAGNGARGQARIEIYNTETVRPTVMLEQAGGQTDPNLTDGDAVFTVNFSEDITVGSFTCQDINLTGTATASCTDVTEIAPDEFEVTVTATTNGTIIASIPAAAVHDIAGNNNEDSTSGDNEVTVVLFSPGGVDGGLGLWLKANDNGGVSTDGSTVTTWIDQSGGGSDATAANSPSFEDGVTDVFNFNPVVDFDGSTDYFTLDNVLGTGNAAYEVFAVSAIDRADDGDYARM